MDADATVLLVVAVAALASAFFTVVPIVPGAIFVPIGAAVCAQVVGWDEFAWWFWAVQAALVTAYLVVDNVAQLFGVRRVGGSRQAMFGGAIGVFAGPILLALVMGPLALLLGPPIGAVAGTIIGEERARRRDHSRGATPREYHRLGVGALVAWALGTAMKLVLVAVQVGVLLYVVR